MKETKGSHLFGKNLGMTFKVVPIPSQINNKFQFCMSENNITLCVIHNELGL